MPRVSKAAEKERRDRIIAVARSEFLSKGFDKTTIKAITDRLNIAKGTFYYHFKSKEEVLVAVCEHLLENVKLKAICETTDRSVVWRLKAAFRVMLDNFYKNASLWRHIHREDNVALHRQIVATGIAKSSPLFVALLEEGNREGVLNAPYPGETPEILVTLIDWYVRQYFRATDQSTKERAFHALEYTCGLILGVSAHPFSLR